MIKTSSLINRQREGKGEREEKGKGKRVGQIVQRDKGRIYLHIALFTVWSLDICLAWSNKTDVRDRDHVK